MPQFVTYFFKPFYLQGHLEKCWISGKSWTLNSALHQVFCFCLVLTTVKGRKYTPKILIYSWSLLSPSQFPSSFKDIGQRPVCLIQRLSHGLFISIFFGVMVCCVKLWSAAVLGQVTCLLSDEDAAKALYLFKCTCRPGNPLLYATRSNCIETQLDLSLANYSDGIVNFGVHILVICSVKFPAFQHKPQRLSFSQSFFLNMF